MQRRSQKPLPPDQVQACLADAQERDRRGDLPGAATAYERVLATVGASSGLQHALALVYARQQKFERAIALLEKAIELAPGEVALRSNLGNVLLAAGRQGEALAAYRAALELAPGHVNAHFNAARLLEKAGRMEEAIFHQREALRLDPQDAEGWNLLGLMLRDQEDNDAARAAFERVLALTPDSAKALVNLGVLAMSVGDAETANSYYMRAIQADPQHLTAYDNIARTRRFGTTDQPFIDHVRSLLDRPGATREVQTALCFALGKMYDDCGDYDEAFAHFARGNALRRDGLRYDKRETTEYVDRTIETFSPRWLRRFAGAGDQSPLPVFVFGMMRSGTTLAEQILSSHRHVLGGGELLAMAHLAEEMGRSAAAGYPRCVRSLDGAGLRALGAAYLSRLPAHGEGIQRVTDKLTYNFLHAGLIATCLPNASLVYCERNAADVCLSVFFQSFAEGHHYAYEQTEIAHVHLEHERLMNYWFEVLPERILRLRYEDVISNTQERARALVAHCGLEWDDACLDYTRNPRAVRTASNWQVRQPVYKTSMERWRRYEKHLGPLLEALQA